MNHHGVLTLALILNAACASTTASSGATPTKLSTVFVERCFADAVAAFSSDTGRKPVVQLKTGDTSPAPTLVAEVEQALIDAGAELRANEEAVADVLAHQATVMSLNSDAEATAAQLAQPDFYVSPQEKANKQRSIHLLDGQGHHLCNVEAH